MSTFDTIIDFLTWSLPVIFCVGLFVGAVFWPMYLCEKLDQAGQTQRAVIFTEGAKEVMKEWMRR
jgi:hypothetical protein